MKNVIRTMEHVTTRLIANRTMSIWVFKKVKKKTRNLVLMILGCSRYLSTFYNSLIVSSHRKCFVFFLLYSKILSCLLLIAYLRSVVECEKDIINIQLLACAALFCLHKY